MNLVRRAAQQIGAGMSLSDLDRVMDMAYGGSPSYTGKLISQTSALQVSAVWSCVSVLSRDIASLPLLTYRYLDTGGRELAPEHYLWGLLQQEANPELTAFRFKQLMQTWVLLWGNAYAELDIAANGTILAAWPWRPDRVDINRSPVDNSLIYTYKLRDNTKRSVPQERMFHLRGLGVDGVYGLSPIELHKNTIGLSMAITEHGGRFYSNGARPLGILNHPGKLNDVAYERLKQEWAKEHQGLSNAHRVAILEEGMTWAEAGSKMVDAQYLETMKFTVTDIARIYGVPPHRIGDLSNSTFSNIEHQGLEYVQYGLRPWGNNWQQEVEFSMLSPRQRQSYHVSFNYRELLRGDHAAMGDFASKMINWGVMSADEIRDELLDMNPQPNGIGKKYWKPVNTVPVGDDGIPLMPAQRQTIDVAEPIAPGLTPKKPPTKNGKVNGHAALLNGLDHAPDLMEVI